MKGLDFNNPAFLAFVAACDKEIIKDFAEEKEYDQKTMQAALDNSKMKFIECDVCQKTENVQLCGRCKSVWYCNADCQTKAWKAHKTGCRSLTLKNLVVPDSVPSSMAESVIPYYIVLDIVKQLVLMPGKNASEYLYDKISGKRTIVFLSTTCKTTGHYYSALRIPFSLVPVTLENS